MARCFWNIRAKNCQNPIIGFQVTVENVGDAFLGHSAYDSNFCFDIWRVTNADYLLTYLVHLIVDRPCVCTGL